MIADADQAIETGFFQAQRVEKLGALLARERRDLGFDLGRDRHRDRAFLFGARRHRLGECVAGGGRAFLDVADVEHGL